MSCLLKHKIQKAQNTCIRFIFGLRKYDHISSYFTQLETLNMEERRTLHGLTTMHKIIRKLAPIYLISKIKFHNDNHNYNTRNRNNIVLGVSRTQTYSNSYFPTFSKLYNNLNNRQNCMDLSIYTFRKYAREPWVLERFFSR